MQAFDVFTARDLRNRSGELLKGATEGNMAVITKHGKPSVLAIPFDSKLLNHGVHKAMALQLFSSGHSTLQQAARFADIPLESFINLLGECGIDAVDYPADELESDLENALAAADHC